MYLRSNGRKLVIQAETLEMNPTFSRDEIKEMMQDDPSRALAEYYAQFRSDLESYVSKEVIQACTATGRIELPFGTGRLYHAFVDPSGGSKDSFTLAIAHNEADKAILDLLREKKAPFSPESVTKEYSELLKSWGIHFVTGDKYAGEYPRELFRKFGIEYKVSELSRSEIYVEFLAVLNSGRAELLDHTRLHTQLLGLERRTGRGADIIDHGPNGKDDVANSGAGALLLASQNAMLSGAIKTGLAKRTAVPKEFGHRRTDIGLTRGNLFRGF